MCAAQRIVVQAPAKINLFLEITGRRADGYHFVDTVMQSVSLHDLVVIGRSASHDLRMSCSQPDIPEDAANLAYRAAKTFFAAAPILEEGLHIHIDKQIPKQAGLGGGSSDAAAVLVGLNQLYHQPFSHQALCAMGASLGADVPFAVQGGCARAVGIGEEMTALPPLCPCQIVLAKPEQGVSTATAYARYDQAKRDSVQTAQQICTALEQTQLADIADALYNVFAAVGVCSQTESIRCHMQRYGAVGAVLSGSGSAVAGMFVHASDAADCHQALEKTGWSVIAEPIPHGAKIIYQN